MSDDRRAIAALAAAGGYATETVIAAAQDAINRRIATELGDDASVMAMAPIVSSMAPGWDWRDARAINRPGPNILLTTYDPDEARCVASMPAPSADMRRNDGWDGLRTFLHQMDPANNGKVVR